MTIEITDFDPAEYLDDDEAIAEYLSDAMESQDQAVIADALGVVARAKGMSALADETGLSRESLYKSLSPKGNPELGTVLKVMKAFGQKMAATPVSNHAH